jgi:hypothetical protein
MPPPPPLLPNAISRSTRVISRAHYISKKMKKGSNSFKKCKNI